MKTTEHNEQAAVFRWAAWNSKKHPELALMFAIPNGGRRDKVTGARLKAEGVKAGVPDIFLPAPRGAWAGLFIEMKSGRNKSNAAQEEWQARLRGAGYKVAVCYGWQMAVAVIADYLGIVDIKVAMED